MTNAPTTNNSFLMMPYEVLTVHHVNGVPFDANMKIAYQYIKGFQDNGQLAYFSRSKLGELLNVKDLAITRMIKKMVEAGLINKEERSGCTNLYTVNPINAVVAVEEAPHESVAVAPVKAPPIERPDTAEALPLQVVGNFIVDDECSNHDNTADVVCEPVSKTVVNDVVSESTAVEEEPDFDYYAAMTAPVEIKGWHTQHQQQQERLALMAAQEAAWASTHEAGEAF